MASSIEEAFITIANVLSPLRYEDEDGKQGDLILLDKSSLTGLNSAAGLVLVLIVILKSFWTYVVPL